MPRLIDADKLIHAIHDDWDDVLVWDESGAVTADEFERLVFEQPTVEQPQINATENTVEIVRCKDCKYFHYNKAYSIQGFSILGNSVCDKWANGCRTDENGYCFLGERREDETD